MSLDSDEAWMLRALALASRGLGRTAPNPAVGAVLVLGGVAIGEGTTEPAGGAHAEIVALRDARQRGVDPRGATLYVTLEPCCHHGRTPPCTNAILAAGLGRVVVGVRDPFPMVRGKGIAQLQAAGVDVVVGVLAIPCARQVLGFARAHTSGLPEVSVKLAVSLDGRIGTATGESQWITGDHARAEGRRLRATHDAILVGVQTVLADDPRLTARAEGSPDPVPVILDSNLRTPAGAKVFQGPRRAIVCCAPHAPPHAIPADIERVPADQHGRPDLVEVARRLVARGHHRLLIEGGGTLIRSALHAGLVDTVHHFMAGAFLPGGMPSVGGEPIAALAQAPRLDLHTLRAIGGDVYSEWHLAHGLAPDPLGVEGMCSPAW